jgi:hypothetical protein
VASAFYCPDSVSGHAQNDRSGRCAWCGYQVDPPCPMPRLGSGYRTDLDLAYRRAYDPDWGTDPHDCDV